MLTVSPTTALAENIDLIPKSGIGQTIGTEGTFNAQNILRLSINLVLMGAGLVAFFFLLIGGVQWIMAGGDKEGTEKARKRITAALLGLAIVFSTYAIAFLIDSIFGISILNLVIPSITTQ